MAATRVGGAAVAATSSVTTQAITLPTLVAGDLIILVHVENPSSGTTTMPTGYTQAATLDVGTGTRAVIWTKIAVSGDSAATITLTNTVAQRLATCAEVYRAVTGVQVVGSYGETAAVTSHASATATTTGTAVVVLFFAERSSTPSTTVTQPSGFTRWNQAFGTGSSACSVASADTGAGSLTSVAAGTVVGAGNWVADVANNNVITFVLALSVAVPVISAGATQTVPTSTAVTLAGTDITVGTVTARAWTQTSGPTVTLSGATTATCTFTPTVADVYAFQYSVTDGGGTGVAYTQVNVTTATPRPVAVTAAGLWTATGGTIPAVLADEVSTTYASSSANPAGDALRVRMAPAGAGQLGVFYDIDVDNSAPPLTLLVELLQGSTVIASWNESPTVTTAPIPHTLTSAQTAAVTNRADLYLRFTASV